MVRTRLELAKETAILAGKLLQDHFQRGNGQGYLKADRTLVTDADREADQFILEAISREFPDDKILSEEGNTVFPDNQHVWVIDPLDGTINFSKGLSCWGVSIAHLQNGQPQTAALYFPVTDELFSAEKGDGADLNGKTLQISTQDDKDLFEIFVHCSRMHQMYQVKLPYKKRSLGAAAYHLCLVSNNSAVLAFESTPKIWDFAGGWLIISEAGGVVESIGKEQPFPARAGIDYQEISYPIAAARSKSIIDKARENIIRK